MKTCINPKLYRLFLEKMVIGLEEPVLVKGIGELVAKVDSGNSGYNVIHGDDIIMQGNIVTFRTFNKDGDERRVSKKLKDTIKINIGGGHIQDRPVVELDVQFGGQDYKKIPFSITDRGDNEHKVLISKDFVGKELDALIDVTKDNIANDNVEVDYVTEGLLSGIKKAAGFAKNVAHAAVHGTEGMQKKIDKAEAFRKAMWGEGGSPKETVKLDPANDEAVKTISELGKIQEEDAKLIPKHIAKSPTNEIVQEKLDCPTDEDSIAVYKLLDFTGGTCGSENADPEFKKRMQKALEAYKDYKKNPEKANKGEKVTVNEAAEETNTSPDNTQNNNPQSAAQNAKKEGSEEDKEPENNDDLANAEQQQDPSKMTEEEVNEVLGELKNRNYSIFYIIGFTKDNRGRGLAEGEAIIKNIKSKIENWGMKIAQSRNWKYGAFTPFANDIGSSIENEGANNAKGFFALVSGKPGSRKAEFYTDGDALFGVNAEGEVAIDDKLVQEYIELNNEFRTLGDDMLGEGDILNSQSIQDLIDFCEENMDDVGERGDDEQSQETVEQQPVEQEQI